MLLLCLITFLSIFEAQCADNEINKYMDINDLDEMPEGYGDTWMFFPDGHGNAQIIYLQEDSESPDSPRGPEIPEEYMPAQFEIKQKIHLTDITPDNSIFFLLCTRNNADQKITLDYDINANLYKVQSNFSNFNKDHQTKIIIHGWKSDAYTDMEQFIKDGYLAKGEYNVILVDWKDLASSNWYYSPVKNTHIVAANIAYLIELLLQAKDADINNIHLIGHSLGAHVAGFVSDYDISGELERISGLDPASPGFPKDDITERLDKTDAKFVDIVHTSAGIIGFKYSIGHVDFFPNGGTAHQPGCSGFEEFLTHVCSHGRSHNFFAESITSEIGFYSYDCSNSYDNFKVAKCNPTPTVMGNPTPNNTRGNYYLQTRAVPSFAMGKVNKVFHY